MIAILEDDMKYINQLCPVFGAKVIDTLIKCKQEGLNLGVFCGLRTFAEQDTLYSKGRNEKGIIINPKEVVTNASGGMSWHNYGLAVDIVFKTDKGWTWESKDWDLLGGIGQYYGLEWGGSWKNILDYPHFQYTKGISSVHVAKEIFDRGGLAEVWKSIIG